MAVTIGDRTFASAAAAQRAIRDIVARWPNGRIIDGEDGAFIEALFWRHPRADEKTDGRAVLGHFVSVDTISGRTRHLNVRMEGGAVTDWSWQRCLAEQSPRHRFLRALRAEVVDDVLAFKARAFASGATLRCPISGRVLSPGTCHVDHVHPRTFAALVDAWALQAGIALDAVRDYVPDGLRMVLDDRALADAWRAYHATHAELRLVDPTENLRAGARGKGDG